jgi:ferredoxin-NADP reductase/Na+-translocating ferredoxin:NAD+ oxidoreductase RnfD subunit
MNIVKYIDNQLNKVTMYRLVAYGLTLLLAGAVLFSITGGLPIKTLAIIDSAVIILTVAFIADRLIQVAWNTTSNYDSSLITSLILCLIMPPTSSLHFLALSGLVTLTAIASKYVLVIHHKHLFNPAAIAALIFGTLSITSASWWVGSPVLLPLTLVVGLLIVRKMRRFKLFLSFILAALIVAVIVGMMHNQSLSYTLSTALKSSPLVFLGSIMLTEPSTTPPRYYQQMIYGVIVGGLFTSQLIVGTISATPEMALIIGNIYAFLVSPKYKLKLKLKSLRTLSPNIYEFSFAGAKNMSFTPGQYLEWTLPDVKRDSRGNRRTFSIASAPNEESINIVIRTSEVSSQFKKTLIELKDGDSILAGQVAGDFILPSDPSQRLVLIAGGIGITPYVSMVKHMIKTKQTRDVQLIYFVSSPYDICYPDLWREAASYGLKFTPIISGDKIPTTWKGLSGRLDQNKLTKIIPDYKERRFYISGPNALVDNYLDLLKGLGINRSQIKTDHFSGY